VSLTITKNSDGSYTASCGEASIKFTPEVSGRSPGPGKDEALLNEDGLCGMYVTAAIATGIPNRFDADFVMSDFSLENIAEIKPRLESAFSQAQSKEESVLFSAMLHQGQSVDVASALAKLDELVPGHVFLRIDLD
jgi:hypothetical protein